MSADADRIAQLTAELAVAQKSAGGYLTDKLAAQRERDEAREWVRKLTADTRVLTCVYCGHAYPPGTPSHGSPILTEHIASCEKHPLTIERAAHERTKAELAAERADRLNIDEHRGRLMRERDAALAEAAALWAFVEWVRTREWTLDGLDQRATQLHDDGPEQVGRALAARLPLLEAIATLTAKMEWKSMCICHLSKPEKCLACTVLDVLAKLAALDAQETK